MATTLAKKKDNKHTDDRWGRKLLRLGENIKDGKIKTFTEAFDLVTESRLSTVTGISFYAFKKKVIDNGEFSINEIARMAVILKTDFDTVWKFIRAQLPKEHAAYQAADKKDFK